MGHAAQKGALKPTLMPSVESSAYNQAQLLRAEAASPCLVWQKGKLHDSRRCSIEASAFNAIANGKWLLARWRWPRMD
jgi:hypothetical protein